MPRITITADPQPGRRAPAILLDERVQSVHLSTDHAAAQLIERLAWAIVDAEASEAERTSRPVISTDRLGPPDRASARATTLRVRRVRPRAAVLGIHD